jgi:four helix bundle protein
MMAENIFKLINKLPPVGYRNKNRGYQQLRVWQDARDLYVLTWEILERFPNRLLKVISNQLSSVDSVHRNIAEGYCRRGINEYLQFLSYSSSSLGESVSSMLVYYKAGHLPREEFKKWDTLAFKVENALIRLQISLEKRRKDGDWIDGFSK